LELFQKVSRETFPFDATRLIEIYAPAAPGSLMRAYRIWKPGLYRLSRRSCELYSVQIVSSGAWGRFRVWDGRGNKIIEQPSTFTGSFWVNGGCFDGLVCEMHCFSPGDSSNLTLNWREPDTKLL
jgi:hypothetical protein